MFTAERARSIVSRIEFVNTPRHGSWLNIAELELSMLSRVGLKKHIASEEELKSQITAYQNNTNEKKKPVNWQFTTKDARIKLKRLYPTLSS